MHQRNKRKILRLTPRKSGFGSQGEARKGRWRERVLKCVAALLGFMMLLPLLAQPSTFRPAAGSPLKIPGGGHAFVTGDVDKDGHFDLVVAGREKLTTMLGDGKGGFNRAPVAPTPLPGGAGEMVLADFNGDGVLDWAGSHHDRYEVVVFLGRGDGTFRPAPGSPFSARDGQRPHTHALVAGDVDGDGKLDLVTANNNDNDVSVLLGDGKGSFTRAPGSPFPCGRSPYPVALADVNGDRKLDIVVPNSGPAPRTVSVLLGNGRGDFRPAPASPFKADGAAYFVTVADLNGDAKPDIVATHDDATDATLLFGDGRGNFQRAKNSPLDLGNRGWSVVAADFDGDGKIDLAFGAEHGVALFLGDGRGEFRRAAGSPFRTGKGTWRIEAVDVNHDGKLDFITNNVESDDISVLLAQ